MRIVAAMPQTIGASRKQLQGAKQFVHLPRVDPPEQPGHGNHDGCAKEESQQGRDDDEKYGFANAAPDESVPSAFAQDGANQTAN